MATKTGSSFKIRKGTKKTASPTLGSSPQSFEKKRFDALHVAAEQDDDGEGEIQLTMQTTIISTTQNGTEEKITVTRRESVKEITPFTEVSPPPQKEEKPASFAQSPTATKSAASTLNTGDEEALSASQINRRTSVMAIRGAKTLKKPVSTLDNLLLNNLSSLPGNNLPSPNAMASTPPSNTSAPSSPTPLSARRRTQTLLEPVQTGVATPEDDYSPTTTIAVAGSTVMLEAESIVSLSEQEVKDLYPSDDDEDFDVYLLDSGIQVKREEPKEGEETEETAKKKLKFTEYVRNPLYDQPIAHQVNKVVIQMSSEEIVRYNEVVRRCKERGDPKCINWIVMGNIDKKLKEEIKKKMLQRRLSSATSLFKKNGEKSSSTRFETLQELQNLLPRDSDAEDSYAAEEKQTYSIKKCPKSWKSQLKQLKPTPPATSPTLEKTEAPAPEQKPLTSNDKLKAPNGAYDPIFGYLPEWRHAMYTKRVMDLCKHGSVNV